MASASSCESSKDFAVGEILRLCKCTGSLSPQDARQVSRISEAAKQAMGLAGAQLVEKADVAPNTEFEVL